MMSRYCHALSTLDITADLLSAIYVLQTSYCSKIGSGFRQHSVEQHYVLSVLAMRHSKAATERPLYCRSQEKTRPEVNGTMYVGHDLADEPSLSENMPPFIEEEELASSSFRLRLRICRCSTCSLRAASRGSGHRKAAGIPADARCSFATMKPDSRAVALPSPRWVLSRSRLRARPRHEADFGNWPLKFLKLL